MDRLIDFVEDAVADVQLLKFFVFSVRPCAVAQEDVDEVVLGIDPNADAREAEVAVGERARTVAA